MNPINQILTIYSKVFPQSKIDDEGMALYVKLLEPILSPIQVSLAMKKLTLTSKFFPSVSEIIEAAKSVTDEASQSTIPSVDEAWREVVQQIHNAFVYKKPKFSTPEIERAALNMGWTSLCYLEVGEMNTARAQFRDIYNGIIKREKDKKVNNEVLKTLPDSRLQELVNKTTDRLKLVQGGVG